MFNNLIFAIFYRIMKRDEIERRYAAGERDFNGISFDDADLLQLNLSGANLQGSVMMKFIWNALI